MKRGFKWDKKYLYWGMTVFCVIAAAILFYMALNYIPVIGKAISAVVGILSPFIWGLVISYLLSPLMRLLQRKLFDPLIKRLYRKSKKYSGKRMARKLSVLVSEIVLLAVLTMLVYMILPQLYSSIEKIVLNSNTYIATASGWIERFLEDYPQIEEYAVSLLGDLNTSLVTWIQTRILPSLASIISDVASGLGVLLVGIYNLIIGIIVSVYILNNLESVKANTKKLIYSIFSVEFSAKLKAAIDFVDKTFIGFIKGKLLDSAIIGLICYIFCTIVKMPYALLVSFIVGVTNIIPFFGPVIGAVPSAFIILLVSPLKCLIFVVFIIILQQVDGNLIGPKILGESIGINGFWVMFSIILGAGLFGFWGMLLGVPIFFVIYTGIGALVKRKLKRSDLPWETADYINMDYIDPVTHEPVMKDSPPAREEEKPQA